jgi:RNA polymerase sigma-70 factor (ECF subfamily)
VEREKAIVLATVSDEELIVLVQRRQEAALGALYDRYIRLVYTIALRITGDRETAEEVVQDVFQSVWQAAGSFQSGVGSPSAWLMGITRHRAIDATRSKRERERARERTLEDLQPRGDESNLDHEVGQRLLRETVRLALEELPSTQRQAIELAYYGGLTRSEIAERLNEPLGTIKTRLRLGLLKLRDLLRHEAEHEERGSLPGAGGS